MKKTALYSCHVELHARMVPFAGYEMPVQYTGLLEESKATRQSAGLFDISHMGQISIRGKGAIEALQSVVTNDLEKLSLGQAQYNLLCNEKGGAVDDLVVYYRSAEHLYLCVNASNKDKDFNWIKEHLPKTFSVTDESEETALIALQGPDSEKMLAKLFDPKLLASLNYYWASEAKLNTTPCYLSRTGYTGEDGFEIYLPNSEAKKAWYRLIELGATPAGLGARDTLRTEMGYALYGHEINENINPLWAGLGWIIKLQKPYDFIGKKSLQAEKERGLTKTLKAFTLHDKRIARQGYAILSEKGTQIGEITSGTLSPHTGCPIALGLLSSQSRSYSIQIRSDAVPATETKLPFVKSKTKGAK